MCACSSGAATRGSAIDQQAIDTNAIAKMARNTWRGVRSTRSRRPRWRAGGTVQPRRRLRLVCLSSMRGPMTRSRRRFDPRRTGACAAALAVALVLAGSDRRRREQGEPWFASPDQRRAGRRCDARRADDRALARDPARRRRPGALGLLSRGRLHHDEDGSPREPQRGFHQPPDRLLQLGPRGVPPPRRDRGLATLVRVEADAHDAAWTEPRECENLIGYWHLPGVRLVYRHGSRVYSVEVDSLISWRGVWYVVHLGPNPRPGYRHRRRIPERPRRARPRGGLLARRRDRPAGPDAGRGPLAEVLARELIDERRGGPAGVDVGLTRGGQEQRRETCVDEPPVASRVTWRIPEQGARSPPPPKS